MIRIASSTYSQQAVAAIDRNQAQLSTLQTQMSSSLRMLTAADDPVAAGQVLSVNQAISNNTQWQSNASALSSSLGLEDSALTNVSSALQQIQTLALQANTATTSSSDRTNIAAQMQQQLNIIMQQANSQDSSGNYLFAGTSGSGAPFSQSGGSVSYGGNSNVNMLALGATSEIAAGDPGDAVFMQTRSGDGNIAVAAAGGNSGSASVAAAAVSNSSQYAGGSYTVSFSGGQYQVTGSGGSVVASGTYSDGTAISFGGVSLTLSGTPADGDSFSVSPSSAQSVFTTVQNLINAVANPGTGSAAQAQNQTAMYGALQALSGAQSHITDTLAGVGARQQAVSTVTSQLQSYSTQLQSSLTNLQDLDYAQATAQYSQVSTALQAAEETYSQIQGLSLFNYIK